MTTVAFVAATGYDDGGVTTMSVTIPGTAQVGDLAIVTGVSQDAAPSAPAGDGWTRDVLKSGPTYQFGAVFHKVLTAGDIGTSKTFTGFGGNCNIGLVIYRNATFGSVGAVTGSAMGTVSTIYDGSAVVRIAWGGSSSSGQSGSLSGTGLTTRSYSAFRMVLVMGEQIVATAGTSPTATATISTGSPASYSIRLDSTGGTTNPAATISAVLPRPSGALTGTSFAAPVNAAVAARLPVLAGALRASVAVPGVGASVAAVLPRPSGALTGGVFGAGDDGFLTASLPALRGSLTGAAEVLHSTDLTYVNRGYNYTGASTVEFTPDVAPMPTTARATNKPISWNHHAISDLIYADGQLSSYAQTKDTAPWADYLRVTCGGKDVTFWRDQPTIVASWQHTDPYGWAAADLEFPQLTVFDDIDTIPFLKPGTRVRIERVLNGAVVGPPLFSGFTARDSLGSTTISCVGDINGRLTQYMHQPRPQGIGTKDAGYLLWRELNYTGVSFARFGGPVTGVPLSRRGDRSMTKLGYCDDVLAMMCQEDGASWTLMPTGTARRVELKQRSMATVHATVDAGAHGVVVDLPRDLFDDTTAVFGEGVSTTGERWRNAKYPNLGKKTVAPYPFTDNRSFGIGTTDADTDTGDGISVMFLELQGNGLLSNEARRGTFDADVEEAIKLTQKRAGLAQTGVVTPSLWRNIYGSDFAKQSFAGSYFEALASDDDTEPYFRGPDGTIVGLNPTYNPDKIRVEQFVSYGENVTKARARRNAAGIVARGGARTGTVTLTSDPVEMSRLALQAGMTMRIRHLLGAGVAGVKVYISSVEVDNKSGSVTLAVSTSAKHYLELAAVIERNQEAKRDAAKRTRHQLRRSTQTSDAIVGWEGESGAGTIRATLVGNTWNVFPMVAAQVGTMGDLRMRTTGSACQFQAVAFKAKPGEKRLNKRLGNPFLWVGADANQRTVYEEHADWLEYLLMIDAWGSPDQPCGYWPRRKTTEKGATTHPVTGKHRDGGSWDFETIKGFIWWAVYPLQDCHISGRARISLNEGV